MGRLDWHNLCRGLLVIVTYSTENHSCRPCAFREDFFYFSPLNIYVAMATRVQVLHVSAQNNMQPFLLPSNAVCVI